MENSKNKKNITNLVILLVVAVGAFYFGTVYGKGQTPTRGQYTGMVGSNGQFGTAGGVRGQGARGGVTAGQILSKDATSVTLKMQDGSTKIVLISPSAQVTKSVSGSESDLIVGENIIVAGATNTDGSITAESVQIRPAVPLNAARTN